MTSPTSGTPGATLRAAPAAINTARQALQGIIDSNTGELDPMKLMDWVRSCQEALKVLAQDDRITAQLATAAAPQFGGAQTRPPPQPKITFSNKQGEKWADFRKAYENLALALGYNDHYARRYLLGCMRDEAFQNASELDHETGSLADILAQYDEVFHRPRASCPKKSTARHIRATRRHSSHTMAA